MFFLLYFKFQNKRGRCDVKAKAITEYTLMVTQSRIEGEPVTQYGVRWKTALGEGCLPNLTEDRDKALTFLGRLQQHRPEPVHLKDLAEDFLEECYGPPPGRL